MSKYLLLNPLTPAHFGLADFEQIEEALDEFGCKMLMSLDTEAQPVAFAVASTKNVLENLCTVVDLDGTMIEYTATYDQLIRV